MTDGERIALAREWLDAAKERLAYTKAELDAPAPEKDYRAGAWWSSRENLMDGLQDRINVIYALFPELRKEDS